MEGFHREVMVVVQVHVIAGTYRGLGPKARALGRGFDVHDGIHTVGKWATFEWIQVACSSVADKLAMGRILAQDVLQFWEPGKRPEPEPTSFASCSTRTGKEKASKFAVGRS